MHNFQVTCSVVSSITAQLGLIQFQRIYKCKYVQLASLRSPAELAHLVLHYQGRDCSQIKHFDITLICNMQVAVACPVWSER